MVVAAALGVGVRHGAIVTDHCSDLERIGGRPCL
jgi:hypothetical protein